MNILTNLLYMRHWYVFPVVVYNWCETEDLVITQMLAVALNDHSKVKLMKCYKDENEFWEMPGLSITQISNIATIIHVKYGLYWGVFCPYLVSTLINFTWFIFWWISDDILFPLKYISPTQHTGKSVLQPTVGYVVPCRSQDVLCLLYGIITIRLNPLIYSTFSSGNRSLAWSSRKAARCCLKLYLSELRSEHTWLL